MNNKIAFIICYNNEFLLNECLSYIELLRKPKEYIIDIITINEATCITEGYNAGMHSSDAKYKIYMHQDVFIINKNFYFDILGIFKCDTNIGMIGMIGYDIVSPTGQMWNSTRYGAIPLYGTTGVHNFPKFKYTQQMIKSYTYSQTSDGYTDVSLIDGLMMITQYDLEWDDTNLKDWDFYDAFQSMNFLENNYRIVVPNQIVPWFIHNDGIFLSMYSYNKYRQIFIQKYNKYLGLSSKEILKLVHDSTQKNH